MQISNFQSPSVSSISSTAGIPAPNSSTSSNSLVDNTPVIQEDENASEELLETSILSLQVDPPNWMTLNGLEIYDWFSTSKKDPKLKPQWMKIMKVSMGYVARNVIKEMVEKKFLSPIAGITLATKKSAKVTQRWAFCQLDNLGNEDKLQELRQCTQAFFNKSITSATIEIVEIAEESSDNLTARIATMAIDPQCQPILSQIFSGVSHAEKRSALDNPSTRLSALWDSLATDFFNNPIFAPENIYTDSRIEYIDPSKPPTRPWTGYQLRKNFSALRTEMTKHTMNFKKSGNIAEGEHHAEGDDEFFQQIGFMEPNDESESAALEDKVFMWSRSVYLFIYVLYERSVPSWCMRQSPEELHIDLGVNTNPQENTRKVDSTVNVKKRQHTFDTAALKEAFKPSQSEIDVGNSFIAKNKIATIALNMEVVKQRIACINEYLLDDDLSMEDKQELRKQKRELIMSKPI